MLDTKGPKERALEKLVPKLKERTVRSERFLMNDAMQPISKKLQRVMESVRSIEKRRGSRLSVILNDLENAHTALEYCMNGINHAAEDYNTYIYALETLYNEYNGGNGIVKPKVVGERPGKLESSGKLISEEMYEKISRRLREKGVKEFNTASGASIGVSKSSLSRFIRVALKRGDVRKTGNDFYAPAPSLADNVVSVSSSA
jgi:hypothetical protein